MTVPKALFWSNQITFDQAAVLLLGVVRVGGELELEPVPLPEVVQSNVQVSPTRCGGGGRVCYEYTLQPPIPQALHFLTLL